MSISISTTGISVTSGGVTRFDTSSKYPVILSKLYFPDGWEHHIDFSISDMPSNWQNLHVTHAGYIEDSTVIARKGVFYDAHPDFCFANATLRSPYGSRKVFINGGIPLDALAGAVDRSGSIYPIAVNREVAAGSVLGSFLQLSVDTNGNIVQRVRSIWANHATTNYAGFSATYEGTRHMIAHSTFLHQESGTQRRRFTVDLSDMQIYVGKFIG